MHRGNIKIKLLFFHITFQTNITDHIKKIPKKMGQMLCGDLQFTKGGHGNHLWAPLQLVSHDIFPSSSGDPVGRNTVFGNASST